MPTVCFSGALRGFIRWGQQQFATQTLRVHLLGLEKGVLAKGVSAESSVERCTFLKKTLLETIFVQFFQKPVDPVVEDPVRQDDDKI